MGSIVDLVKSKFGSKNKRIAELEAELQKARNNATQRKADMDSKAQRIDKLETKNKTVQAENDQLKKDLRKISEFLTNEPD